MFEEYRYDVMQNLAHIISIPLLIAVVLFALESNCALGPPFKRTDQCDPWKMGTYCMTRSFLHWKPGTVRYAMTNEQSIEAKSPSLLFIG